MVILANTSHFFISLASLVCITASPSNSKYHPPKLSPAPTESYSSHKAGLFMIESSGRNTLTARQACAVESAVLQSGMQVILVVMASNLDLRDNTTCYLYMKSDKVEIFSLDIQTFVENSPLGKE